MTLEERVRWIVAHPEKYGSDEPSAMALCKKAGLPIRNLSVFFTRAKKNPKADLDRGTLTKLAKASGYSFAWLANNEGSPDDEMTVIERGLQAARLLGYDEADIEAAKKSVTANARAGRTPRDVLKQVIHEEETRLNPFARRSELDALAANDAERTEAPQGDEVAEQKEAEERRLREEEAAKKKPAKGPKKT